MPAPVAWAVANCGKSPSVYRSGGATRTRFGYDDRANSARGKLRILNHIVPNVTCDYKFAEAGVYDVVESDFFDWVVEIEGGEAFIRTLAKSLMRFVWGDVGQYVLKILYENFIGTETRKRLGEY